MRVDIWACRSREAVKLTDLTRSISFAAHPFYDQLGQISKCKSSNLESNFASLIKGVLGLDFSVSFLMPGKRVGTYMGDSGSEWNLIYQRRGAHLEVHG